MLYVLVGFFATLLPVVANNFHPFFNTKPVNPDEILASRESEDYMYCMIKNFENSRCSPNTLITLSVFQVNRCVPFQGTTNKIPFESIVYLPEKVDTTHGNMTIVTKKYFADEACGEEIPSLTMTNSINEACTPTDSDWSTIGECTTASYPTIKSGAIVKEYYPMNSCEEEPFIMEWFATAHCFDGLELFCNANELQYLTFESVACQGDTIKEVYEHPRDCVLHEEKDDEQASTEDGDFILYDGAYVVERCV